jgi:CHRD domain
MRQKRVQLAAAVAVVAIASVVATTAFAGGGKEIREELEGYQEVPAVSTDADGKFKAKIREDRIDYRLSYEDLSGPVTQAHIHFGQRSVNGGISVFLCTNLGNGPAGTQPCPPAPATITGTIRAADVVGPSGGPTPQGIAPGEFEELLRAIRAGVTYANVHSQPFPGGEIRAQLNDDRDHDDDD